MAKRKRSVRELIEEKYPDTLFDKDMIFIMNHNLFRVDMMKYILIWYKSKTPSKIRRFVIWILKYNKGNSERKMKVLFGWDRESFNKWVYERRCKRVNCVEYYTSRGYSENEARKLVCLSQKKINNKSTEKRVNSWHKTFSEKTENELKEINAKKSVTLEVCIKKYGLEKGTERWNEILKKKNTNSIESIMSRGFSEEEAISIKNSINKKQSENTPFSVTYWINKGYSEEDVKMLHSAYLKTRENFSFEYCVEKYGKEKGLEIFNKRQQKWQETLNSKSDEEIETINRKKSHRYNYAYWNFPKDEKGYFYALKLFNNFIKIGITYKSIGQRYKDKYLQNASVILNKQDTLENCFVLEQILKRNLSEYKITKEEAVEGFGWTETFNIQEDEFMLEFNTLMNTNIMLEFKEMNKGYY